MEWLNYVVLALYIIGMVVIAVICRNRAKNTKDFLLAGSGIGGWMSAFAYGTTYFSSVIFIGYAGNLGWDFGLSVIFIGIGNALIGSYFAWKVLAKRTKNITRYYDVKTMPELFEKRYESKHIKMMASIIMFVFLIPYSASVYQGLGYIFEAVFKIDFIWCILIMAVLTAVYLFFGGYLATAISDFVQGIIMIVGILVMISFVFSNDAVNGIEGIKELTESGLGFIPDATNGGFFNSNFFNLTILVLLTSFGMWGLPQSVHKFYAIKDTSAIKKATIISTIFCLIIGVGAYLTGAVGRLFIEGGKPEVVDSIVPTILMKCLPAGLMGLIVVLVLSASMSTLSSLSLSGSSTIAVDLYKGYISPKASDKQVNILMKCLCLCFVILSVVLALFKLQAIVTLMSLSWGTLAGCFIGPYVYGLYSKKVNKWGAYASMISGLAVTFILVFVFGAVGGGEGFMGLINTGIKKAPLIGVIAMGLSMIVTPLFSLCGKKMNQDKMDKLFAIVKGDIENIKEKDLEADIKEIPETTNGEVVLENEEDTLQEESFKTTAD